MGGRTGTRGPRVGALLADEAGAVREQVLGQVGKNRPHLVTVELESVTDDLVLPTTVGVEDDLVGFAESLDIQKGSCSSVRGEELVRDRRLRPVPEGDGLLVRRGRRGERDGDVATHGVRSEGADDEADVGRSHHRASVRGVFDVAIFLGDFLGEAVVEDVRAVGLLRGDERVLDVGGRLEGAVGVVRSVVIVAGGVDDVVVGLDATVEGEVEGAEDAREREQAEEAGGGHGDSISRRGTSATLLACKHSRRTSRLLLSRIRVTRPPSF
ncbi:MAG: hypothetical protein UY82_C0026G0006 [Candidatus Uhrbacteria bacterium GW2011_GWC2_53_7]|uniref:Uncharacterized protein n=1 Tax=Candidatus Uhrbacteria bacterium GW2011_GWC2_53_7 TaxID=1618986 RepID=A0A0G1XZL0_9BACT|nr:MAG: hypothetical protein UY82_C0026G0006 [Candidatus Uhrbacteria bacterium GW2011_GWC2_53_7]